MNKNSIHSIIINLPESLFNKDTNKLVNTLTKSKAIKKINKKPIIELRTDSNIIEPEIIDKGLIVEFNKPIRKQRIKKNKNEVIIEPIVQPVIQPKKKKEKIIQPVIEPVVQPVIQKNIDEINQQNRVKAFNKLKAQPWRFNIKEANKLLRLINYREMPYNEMLKAVDDLIKKEQDDQEQMMFEM